MPANACESSEQPLPLGSEEVRSRSSATWLDVPQWFMGFSLACTRLLAWRPTHDSRQQ